MSKAYSSVELFSFNSAVAFVGLSPFHNPNDTAQTLLTDVNIGIYNKANSSAIKFHTFTVHKQEIVYRFSSSLTKLIVFYNFDYELEILRDLAFHVDCEIAEWNGHKHESVPSGDTWIYLVQYTSGAEAWNCTTTDALVMYSLNYSYRVTEQVMGRIDRLNTKYVDLHYYFIRSSSTIDLGVWRALQAKKDFNESAFRL